MKIPRVANKNPITEGDFHGFLLVSVRVLNRYEKWGSNQINKIEIESLLVSVGYQLVLFLGA